MSLFPIIQPPVVNKTAALPMYADVKWDFENDLPVFENGSPVMGTGREAVATWAWNALRTERRLHEIWTRNYGNDMYGLIGKPFTEELKQSEAARYIRECLMTSPYVSEVRDIEVTFNDDRLAVSCTVITIYGEVDLLV